MNGADKPHCDSSMAAEEEEEERGADTGTKLSPVCSDADMKIQATSTEALCRLCFSESFSLTKVHVDVVANPGSESNTQSNDNLQSSANDDTDVVLSQLMEKSAAINSTVADRTISRHGRSSQRWVVNNDSPEVIRLVTGCVPILNGGKIMLVSASKKKEWIIPKGGWEMDEEVEESAIRETFEEAGVMGVLGPKLTEIQYETRKAKKRRAALEEQGKDKPADEEPQIPPANGKDASHSSEDNNPSRKQDDTFCFDSTHSKIETIDTARIHSGPVNPASPPPAESEKSSEGTNEAPLVYSHACATLFPLYIKEVMPTWPEKGRLRKAVDIDEAIELLVGRPEMQSALLEVKARKLHLV